MPPYSSHNAPRIILFERTFFEKKASLKLFPKNSGSPPPPGKTWGAEVKLKVFGGGFGGNLSSERVPQIIKSSAR
jgi:hypothetical protein